VGVMTSYERQMLRAVAMQLRLLAAVVHRRSSGSPPLRSVTREAVELAFEIEASIDPPVAGERRPWNDGLGTGELPSDVDSKENTALRAELDRLRRLEAAFMSGDLKGV
jgi:hypothetical protein